MWCEFHFFFDQWGYLAKLGKWGMGQFGDGNFMSKDAPNHGELEET